MAVSITKFSLFRRKAKKQIISLDDDVDLANTENEASTREMLRILSNEKNPKRFSTHYIEFVNRVM